MGVGPTAASVAASLPPQFIIMSKLKRRKRAPKGAKAVCTVEHLGYRIDIKSRPESGGFYFETRIAGDRRRISAKTSDLDTAKERAEEFAEALERETSGGEVGLVAKKVRRGRHLTIGDVFDIYREETLAGLDQGYWYNMRKTIAIVEAIWGRDLEIRNLSQAHIDAFVKTREAGGFQSLSPKGHLTTRQPASQNTIRNDMHLTRVIFNTVGNLKHEGEYLIPASPFRGLKIPAEDPNAKQPVADQERYNALLSYAEVVEVRSREESGRGRWGKVPEGIFTTLLLLLRNTGKRVSATRKLRIGDVLLTRAQMRQALASAGGKHQVSWADHWPHGAILWHKRFDKKGVTRVTPISARVREALLAYLATRGSMDPDAPLFPAPRNNARPISLGCLKNWAKLAEELARADGVDLPSLEQGVFHPFRRWWRSERAGVFDTKLVSICGGWVARNLDAVDQGYLQFLPIAMYLCVEFDPAEHLPDDVPIPGILMPGVAAAIREGRRPLSLMNSHRAS